MDITLPPYAIDHDLIARKVFALLHPELRRMKKSQNKHYNTLNARLAKIEEDLSAVFFLASNHTPKVDFLVKRIHDATEAPTTADIPPPPPLIITTNETISHIPIPRDNSPPTPMLSGFQSQMHRNPIPEQC